jgi:hypothetical protein
MARPTKLKIEPPPLFPLKGKENELIAVYNGLIQEKLDYVNRKWETVKSSTYLTIGLLAGIGAITTTNPHPPLLLILGALLIGISPIIFIWCYSNVKREAELQTFNEFSIFQIEKIWGFHNMIDGSEQWLTGYPFIFEQKHLSIFFHCDIRVDEYIKNPPKAWVNGRVKNQKFLQSVLFLNIICLIISIILGIALILTNFLISNANKQTGL